MRAPYGAVDATLWFPEAALVDGLVILNPPGRAASAVGSWSLSIPIGLNPRAFIASAASIAIAALTITSPTLAGAEQGAARPEQGAQLRAPAFDTKVVKLEKKKVAKDSKKEEDDPDSRRSGRRGC
jgi:hypothetical protein